MVLKTDVGVLNLNTTHRHCNKLLREMPTKFPIIYKIFWAYRGDGNAWKYIVSHDAQEIGVCIYYDEECFLFETIQTSIIYYLHK